MTRIWSLRATPPLNEQISWYQAANFDYLSESRRTQLGRLSDPSVRAWHGAPSACDAAAGAYYDPDRQSPGPTRSALDASTALGVCSGSANPAHDDPRRSYELGRVLYVQGNFGAARQAFEQASSRGYRAADIDWADLLLNPAAGSPDPQKAARLYQQAWQHGVSIAAARLGELDASGLLTNESGSLGNARTQESTARNWYQRGAQSREPTAIGHLGELVEREAIQEQAPKEATQKLVTAFGLYACAAELARQEDWPDDTWRVWRHRRATLARELASEGMITAVVAEYHKALAAGRSGAYESP